MEKSRSIQVAYVTIVVTAFLTLDIALAIFVINWFRLESVLMFAFLVFFNFSFAMVLSKRILAFLVKPYQLPKLEKLTAQPKVAILYATMNDVVPESLSSISQTYPSDIYVLDDSSDPEKRSIVDRIAKQRGYTILRREHRQGFKAGAINNWIRTYGDKYDYIVLMDADSYLPPDWVEEGLKYCEHPLNSNVSTFQGLINIWNLDTTFVKTLAPLQVFGQDIWEKRLANHLDAVFCYGHNVFLRMNHVREVGGFVEGYVSEDFATAVELAQKGHKSRFIPIHTYEAMPENIRGFIKRQNKWTRGSMEFYGFSKKPKLSPLQRLLLIQTPLDHFAYVVILTTMLLTIFGYSSTIAHLIAFTLNLYASNLLYILSIPLFQYIIVTSIVSGAILWVKLHELGVGVLAYLKYQFLSKAIGAIMLPYEVKTIFTYLSNKKLAFAVTPKSETAMSLREAISISKATILLMTMLTVGLILINPLGIVYNITWLAPFFISPIVIYFFCRTGRHVISGAATLTNGASATVTSHQSQPETVSYLLNSLRTEEQPSSPEKTCQNG